MATRFTKLNTDWNAEPNVPFPMVAVDGSSLWLRFHPKTHHVSHQEDGGRVFLVFEPCHRFRFTTVNDHGWYLGQCRFSRLAPAWGAFYQVDGDFLEQNDATPWRALTSQDANLKNFLFYFRDEAFECSAAAWRFERKAPRELAFQKPFLRAEQ